MRTFAPLAFILLASTLSAQEIQPSRAFDYDQNAPLDIQEVLVEHRGDISVHDISYASPKGGRVPAYLVVPRGGGRSPPSFGGIGIGQTRNSSTEKSFSMKQLC